MRIAAWNIRAGGGKRIPRIAEVLFETDPDVIVLTEFRSGSSAELLRLLAERQYHSVCGKPDGIQNCVGVFSKHPIEPVQALVVPASHHRWVLVNIPQLDLNLLAVHVPNQHEKWNKAEFWSCIEAFHSEFSLSRALIVGDLNTALDEDCEGAPIREAVHMKRLLDSGWTDAWRMLYPEAREFSWYSHRQNGFRLDHCLASPSLAGSVTAASYRHDVRTDQLSDHSMLVVDIQQLPSAMCDNCTVG